MSERWLSKKSRRKRYDACGDVAGANTLEPRHHKHPNGYFHKKLTTFLNDRVSQKQVPIAPHEPPPQKPCGLPRKNAHRHM